MTINRIRRGVDYLCNGTALDMISTLDSAVSDSSNNWNYDALGNQTSTQGGSQTRTFNAQNQIASITGQTTTPVYDNNGNLTTDQNGVTYHYDAWNRMVFSSAGPNGDEVLRYDALGRSLLSWFDGNTANTYYSQNWQPIEDDLSPTSIHTYVWGARGMDDLIARDQTGFSRLYVQQDANDNVTAIGGSSITERFVYDAYGSVTVLSNAWATTTDTHLWTILYQGARYDTYSNFYIMRNRIYDPVTGTWMQQDPTGTQYVDGANLYQFVGSEPVNALDPSGDVSFANLVRSALPGWRLGGSWSKTFLLVPLGPGRLMITITFAGEVYNCCQQHHIRHDLTGSATGEIYWAAGYSTQAAKQYERDKRVPLERYPSYPPGPMQPPAAYNPPAGYRDRTLYGSLSTSLPPCAQGWQWNPVYVFLRGSAGAYWGIQGSVSYTFGASSNVWFSWANVSADFSVAKKIYGISIEAGGGSSVSFSLLLPF